jgi:hypothetical protein
MCSHVPQCPPADSPKHRAANVISSHYEQGWSLLCNGVVLFTDNGELLPDGRAIAPPPIPQHPTISTTRRWEASAAAAR